MYAEGQEAMFWSGVEECAAMCDLALSDEVRRQAMAKAGQQRLMRNGHFNEITVGKIIETAGVL